MKITTLVENTTLSPELKNKHGLSLYIETGTHKVVFDVGPDKKFLQNAARLGVDITAVDSVVISHGHSDHGGGLKAFLEANQSAKIYVHKQAFETHTARILPGIAMNVSLDPTLQHNQRLVINHDSLKINENLQLFSHVEGNRFHSRFNDSLYAKVDGKNLVDTFAHEQHLIVTENGKTALFAGCSHRGIVNILTEAEKICGNELDIVVAGFHLFNPASRAVESPELIQSIARVLKEKKTVFYTGHCTGQKAFELMQQILGEKIQRISTGSSINLN